jgi:hypothetical protein
MMKANDALTNTEWLRDVRDALQQQSEEIQRLRIVSIILRHARLADVGDSSYAKKAFANMKDNAL